MLQMDIHRGVKAVGFLSVVLSSATLGVCGWIFLTYEFGNNFSTHENYNSTFCKDGTPAQNQNVYANNIWLRKESCSIVTCFQVLEEFIRVLVRNSFISSLTSAFQLVMSAYILAVNSQEAGSRAKLWTILNIGCNLIYVICFSSAFTFPVPKKCYREMLFAISNLKYISSYYIILAFDIFFGFLFLISMMLMIRYEKNLGYILVLNI